jgi:hypothetical protein
MIYRNANHTRFEHSLGVFHLAGLLERSLTSSDNRCVILSRDQEGNEIAQDAERANVRDIALLSLGALVHDIGNYPFCHQLQQSMPGQMPDHEQIGSMMVRGLFKGEAFLSADTLGELQVSASLDTLADIINSKSSGNVLSPHEQLFKQMINGPYGLDFLDYMMRDSFYCGFSTGSSADFLIDHCVILCDRESGAMRLGFSHQVMHELVSFAQQRLDLEKKVYSNKTHRIITAMLSRAIALAVDAARLNIHDLHTYTDDGLLSYLEGCQQSRKLIELLRSRNLYEVVYRFDAKKRENGDLSPVVARALELWGPTQVVRLERLIYDEIGELEEGDLLVSFPSPEERTYKEGEALVVNLETGLVGRLRELDPWIREYEAEYAKLRKYLVLLSPRCFRENGLADKVGRRIQSDLENWVLEIHGVKEVREESVQERLSSLSDIQWNILALLLERPFSAEGLGTRIDGRSRSRTTIAYHLGKLNQLGLVRKQRAGRKVVYGISPEYEAVVQRSIAGLGLGKSTQQSV